MSVEQTAVRGGQPAPRVGAGRLRAAALGLAGMLVVAVLWEVYKALGPDDGVLVGGTRVLPRTTDLVMPHTWEMLSRLLAGTTSAEGAAPLWLTVAQTTAVSFSIALAGLAIGTVAGVLLGVAMQSVRMIERGLAPWLVLSQTVPLIAFAPVVRSWGSQIEIGSWQWPGWLSVALIASYLAFFPIAIGTLMGLRSAPATQVELMHALAAPWWRTLVSVRLPNAVPYLLPAVRLGAASAVVGTIVAEVSIAYLNGVGRQLVAFAGQASGDPAKPWGPIVGAILLGLLVAGLVELAGLALRRYRRGESS